VAHPQYTYTKKTLLDSVRRTFPGSYDDWPDDHLYSAWMQRYPAYEPQVDPSTIGRAPKAAAPTDGVGRLPMAEERPSMAGERAAGVAMAARPGPAAPQSLIELSDASHAQVERDALAAQGRRRVMDVVHGANVFAERNDGRQPGQVLPFSELHPLLSEGDAAAEAEMNERVRAFAAEQGRYPGQVPYDPLGNLEKMIHPDLQARFRAEETREADIAQLVAEGHDVLIRSEPESRQTFGEAIRRNFGTRKGLLQMLPIFGSVDRAFDKAEVWMAARRLANDHYPPENAPLYIGSPEMRREADEELLWEVEQVNQARAREQMLRDSVTGRALGEAPTWWHDTAEVALNIPRFAGEFVASGGAAAVGRTAGRRGVLMILGNAARTGGGKNLARLGGALAGTVTRSVLFAPHIAEQTLENMMPDYSFGENEAGEFQALIEPGSGDEFGEAFVKGYGDVYIELLSEVGGAGMQRAISMIPGGNQVRLVKAALLRSWLGQNSSRRIAGAAQWMARNGGWNGMFEEVGEERLGAAMRALVNLGEWEDVVPSGRELSVEMGAFALPGVGNVMAEVARSVGERGLAAGRQQLEASTAERRARNERLRELINGEDERIRQATEQMAADAETMRESAEADPRLPTPAPAAEAEPSPTPAAAGTFSEEEAPPTGEPTPAPARRGVPAAEAPAATPTGTPVAEPPAADIAEEADPFEQFGLRMADAVQPANMQEAMRLWSSGVSGSRMFAVHEQEDTPIEITDLEMLQNYAPDQMYAFEDVAPAEGEKTVPSSTPQAEGGAPELMTPEAWREDPRALRVPEGILSLRPEEVTEENLQQYSGRDLQALAIVLNVPKSGTKAKKIGNIVAGIRLREQVADATVESLVADFNARELKEMATTARAWRGGNKKQLAAGILQWRDRARAEGQRNIALARQSVAVSQAIEEGRPVNAWTMRELLKQRYIGQDEVDGWMVEGEGREARYLPPAAAEGGKTVPSSSPQAEAPADPAAANRAETGPSEYVLSPGEEGNFYIQSSKDGFVRAVDAKRVRIPGLPEIEFFLHRAIGEDEGGWRISDALTGQNVSKGSHPTQRAARDAVNYLIEKNGLDLEKYREAQQAGIERAGGHSPRYMPAAELASFEPSPATGEKTVPSSSPQTQARAEPAKKKKPAATAGEGRSIGQNAAGEEIFEDDNGVRSRVTDTGFRVTEPVELVPTRSGYVPGVDPAERSDQFKTTDELADSAEEAPAEDDGEAAGEIEEAPDDVFPDPPEQVRAEKVAQAAGELLTPEEANERLEEWKAEAARISEEEDHSGEVIISLFDRTGVWSDPYAAAGYNVMTIDAETGEDVFAFSPQVILDTVEEQGWDIVGILAAPPCTSFAVSGARWWENRHDMHNPDMVEEIYGRKAAKVADSPVEAAEYLGAYEGMLVELARSAGHTVEFYALENPIGRIAKRIGLPKPTLTFQPNNYGDPYTKKTQLWGEFNPDLPQANVEPTEGSKIAKLRGDVPEQKAQRSVTPEGFAYSFFMANHGPAVAQPVPGTPEVAAPAGAEGVILATDEALQANDKKLDNRWMQRIANDAYGGERGEGAYTPRDAYDAMEAGVNLHIENMSQGESDLVDFADPAGTVDRLVALTNRLPRQTTRTKEQVEFQQFSTVPTEAFVATVATGIRPGMTVLEPSAGTGNLATMAKLAGGEVITNEISERRQELLKYLGYPVHAVDAIHLHSMLPADIAPDVVLMNPPFSAQGGKVSHHRTEFGAKHVTEALARLKTGGRLVAIVGQGMAHDRPGFAAWWTKIERRYNVRANIGIDGKHYGKYGTGFDNNIIVIDKTGPTPGETRAEKLLNITRADGLSPAEALELLEPLGREEISERLSEDSGEDSGTGSAGGVRPGVRSERSEPGAEPSAGTGGTSAGRRGTSAAGDSVAGQRSERRDVGTVAEPGEPGRDAAETPAADGERAAEGAAAGADGPGESTGVGRGSSEQDTERSGFVELDEDLAIEGLQEEDAGLFAQYRVQKARLKGAQPHPANIVESAALASVEAPAVTYQPKLPAEVIKEGRVSDLQLEPVVYGGQRHSELLPDGRRAGYLITDGTGLGKGREIAAIIYDNLMQGRKRAVWVSISHDLKDDAIRDLEAVGVPMELIHQRDIKPGDPLPDKDGVLFTTYSMLRQNFKTSKDRYKQVVDWMDAAEFDGVIAFDEAHQMKNAYVSAHGGKAKADEGTLQGQMGLQLDDDAPDARFLYVSATAATEARNMGYMGRLGLWGAGAPFGTFIEFMEAMKAGGVGALEMLSRDLKAIGALASRSISYEGVEQNQVMHNLTDAEVEQYDTIADFWSEMTEVFGEAADNAGESKRTGGNRWSQFYSAQQRFFLQLMMSYQLPELIAEVEKDLAEGRSAVINVFHTNESATASKAAKAQAQGVDLEDLDFTPRDIIESMIDKQFPMYQYEDQEDPATGKVQTVMLKDAAGNPLINRENYEMKEQLLSRLAEISLPANPFDEIVNHFGVDRVAEVSGRKQRLNYKTGQYEKRKIKGVKNKDLNRFEMQQFQDGRKNVALISASATTGISLHADQKAKSKDRRRVFYAMELSWSADTQFQAFGRVHRSFQESAPIIRLVLTNLAGQQRLVNTVARRLAGVGAINTGERQAVGGDLFAQEDITDKYGQGALMQTYDAMMEDKIPNVTTGLAALERMGVVDAEGGIKQSAVNNVTKFLNGIMGLRVREQNAVFEYFYDWYQRIIERAKEEGMFDLGVQRIPGENIREMSQEVVHTDELSGAETKLIVLEGDFKTDRIAWETVERLRERDPDTRAYYENKRSGKMYLGQYDSMKDRVKFVNPRGNQNTLNGDNTPRGAKYALNERYTELKLSEAAKRWRAEFAEIPETETRPIHLLSGAVFPIYDKLQGLTRSRVARAVTDAGEPYVGLEVQPKDVPGLKQRLGIGVALAGASGKEIYDLVHDNRSVIELDNQWRIRMTRVSGEDRMEVDVRGQLNKGDELTGDGAFEEIIEWKKRYFVPLSTEGPVVLDRILKKHKAIRDMTVDAADVGRLQSSRDSVISSITPTPTGAQARDRAPSWVAEVAETKRGKRLVELIRRDPDGRKVGIRSIVEMLNRALGVEMREGREQTTRRKPANYRNTAHLIRTRSSAWQYNFHEHGHAIYRWLTEENPKWLRGFGAVLTEFTEREGSMASAKNATEGLAEWARLFVTDYAEIDGLPITRFLENHLTQHHPEFLEALRDANRAYFEHGQRDPGAQLRSFGADQPAASWLSALKRAAEYMGFTVASGHPLEHVGREVFRAIRQGAKDRATGTRLARIWRNQVFSRAVESYQTTLGIPGEVADIFEGTGNKARNGVRVLDPAGEYVQLSNLSAQDIYEKVGAKNWDTFDLGGYALTLLERWHKKRLEYPGMADGLTPEHLAQIVAEARDAVPKFDEAYKDVQDYMQALLEVAVMGGDMSEEEAERIRGAYEHYWPLPPMPGAGREVVSGRGRRGSPSAGFRRAFGSARGRMPILDAMQKRTGEVIGAYYENRAALMLLDVIRRTSNDKSLSFEARAAMARVAVPMKLDVKKMATLSEEEMKDVIADYLNQKMEQELGRPLDPIGEAVTAKDVAFDSVGKAVWRATAPRGVNIIAPILDGRRVYLQIEDPVLFQMFAGSREPAAFMKWIDKIATPVTEPWKRAITQTLPFAVGNMLSRDPSNAVLMGEGREGQLKGMYLLTGLLNRIAGKKGVPEARKTAELFTRTLETTTSGAHRIRLNAFTRMLSEGIILDKWRGLAPAEKAAAVPGVVMSTILKPVDVLNFITGGKFISGLGEELGREGAFVWKKRQGESTEAARMAYDTVTGNFGEHSGFSSVRALLRPLGFTNAGLQIMYRQYLRLSDVDPATRATAWYRLGVVAVTAAAGWALKQMIADEDDAKRERERPVWDRMGYMDIKGIRIPFDYGALGAIESTVWNTLDHMYGGRPILQRREAAHQVLKRLIDLPGSPMDFLQPTQRAFVEATHNRSYYFGRNIDSPWMEAQDLPMSERAHLDTPKFYKALGRWFNYSPLRIQHIVRQGFARQYDEVIRMLDRVERGQEIAPERADIPLVGRLFIRNPVGFNAASVQSVSALNQRYERVRRRLVEMGAATIERQRGGGTWLRVHDPRLIVQVNQLEMLHTSMNMIDELGSMGRELHEAFDDPAFARDMQQAMIPVAQTALAMGQDWDEVVRVTEEYVEEMREAMGPVPLGLE